jgi:hypothetical protein
LLATAVLLVAPTAGLGRYRQFSDRTCLFSGGSRRFPHFTDTPAPMAATISYAP